MEAAAMEAAAETAAVEATTTKASAVEATTTASTATASETGLGRRERKAETDNLTECCCFHGERYVTAHQLAFARPADFRVPRRS